MKIKVEVEVPDEENCYECKQWIEYDGKDYCEAFGDYILIDNKPCQPCLDARKEVKDEQDN